MKFIIHYAVVVRGSYEVDADTVDAAQAAFRASGDQRHVFAAYTRERPEVRVESVEDVVRGATHYADGSVEIK